MQPVCLLTRRALQDDGDVAGVKREVRRPSWIVQIGKGIEGLKVGYSF